MLADWLGLPTLDFCLIEVTADDEIPLYGGGIASPGPAFISRAEPGMNWGGTSVELETVDNRRDISGLVVLDTWLRNCDRYNPGGERMNRDNVFFVQYPGGKKRVLLKAMDFTHAFTCGRALTRRLGFIENVRDERIYGLFPEFPGYLSREEVGRLAARLKSNLAGHSRSNLSPDAKRMGSRQSDQKHLGEYDADRARFVSETIESRLWPQQELHEGGTV